MYRIHEITGLIDQSRTGVIPPVGDLGGAEEVIGFSFGHHLDNEGQLADPGPINKAIARFMANDEAISFHAYDLTRRTRDCR